jgi:hypothetical protein
MRVERNSGGYFIRACASTFTSSGHKSRNRQTKEWLPSSAILKSDPQALARRLTGVIMYVIKARAGWAAAACLAAAGVGAAGPARADLAASSSDTGGGTSGLEEIIVTARRRGIGENAVPPYTEIEYFNALKDAVPGRDDFVRLYLAPGVMHCAGGPGPQDTADRFSTN